MLARTPPQFDLALSGSRVDDVRERSQNGPLRGEVIDLPQLRGFRREVLGDGIHEGGELDRDGQQGEPLREATASK